MTQEIVEIAREKLDITNDKLYDALYDHIAFAIERLKMGLLIDNPFIGEIAIMCSRSSRSRRLPPSSSAGRSTSISANRKRASSPSTSTPPAATNTSIPP
ncbi:MAG: PRD domain-containing protein [Anaerotruncus massiliensis (ex Togo et al. 2019)]